MVAAVANELVGEVKAANAKGVLLAGRGEWANWSRWAEHVITPQPGERVMLKIDSSGFIRTLVAVDGEPAAAAAVAAGFQPVDRDVSSMRPATPERLAARVAALAAAVRIVGRPTSIGEVLATAAQIETWLSR